MKTILSTIVPVLLVAQIACSQGGPQEKKLPVEIDSAGTPKTLDYGLPMQGISDPGMLLSHFSQRMLLIYYYSPKCPHCISSYPKYQAIVNEFSPQGLAGIAISVGQVKRNDIRAFMDGQNVTVPMFQDTNRKFGDLYGVGHVPMLMLVYEDGRFVRFQENNDQVYATLRAELTKRLRK